MENVEQILLNMLPGKEEKESYLVFYLQSRWSSICGENVAKHSKPVQLENKVLYINTDSSVWSNHLLLMKKQFLKNINKQFLKNINGALKKRAVSDLKFFNGSVDNLFLKNAGADEKPAKIILDKDELAEIKNLTSIVKNDGLQQSLISFKAASAKREKFLTQHGAQKCSKCGAVINGSGNLCNVCARYEREKQHDAVVKFLLTEPWSDYENCKKTLNCDKILYDSVKNNLKQHYYAKVANNTATTADEMLAVMLKIGKTPALIDDKTYQNVLANLRRK